MKKAIILFLSLLFGAMGFASEEIDFEKLKKKYSKHNAVILNEDYEYTIDIKGDSLAIQQKNSKRVLILSEHSKAYTNDYVYENGFTHISDIEAYTLIPTEKKYKKIKVES